MWWVNLVWLFLKEFFTCVSLYPCLCSCENLNQMPWLTVLSGKGVCVFVCARTRTRGRKEHTSTETKSSGLGSEQGSLICCPLFLSVCFHEATVKSKSSHPENCLPCCTTCCSLGADQVTPWMRRGGSEKAKGWRGSTRVQLLYFTSAWINHRLHIVVMNHPAHELTPLSAFHSNKRLAKDKTIPNQLLHEGRKVSDCSH